MNLSSKNIVPIFILALLLIYGGLKGLVYYKFKTAVDNTSAQMRVFASLRYDTISSSLLDNSVTIHKVSILPSGFEEGIKIDALTLQTHSLGSLLSDFNFKQRSSQNNDFPQSMYMAMTGLKIDLYGSMVDKLEQALAQLDSGLPKTIKTSCGNKLYLGPAEYRDMGYDILDSNVHFAYTFSPSGINIDMDWSTKDMASANLQIKMSGPSRASTMAITNNPPQLEEIMLNYTDLSYSQRTNEYCTQQGKYKTTQDYINAASSQSDGAYALQWGFIPGPGIKQAYKDFLTNPDNVKILMRPPKGFNQSTIGLYKPNDLIDILNIEVSVNDQTITDLNFAFPDNNATSDMSLQGRLENFKSLIGQEQTKPTAIKKVKPKIKGPPPRYHRVSVKQLKPFIGEKVRIYTRNNQIRRGVLSKITSKTIDVTKRVHRGEFIMNINKTSVKKVEVLYAK